MASSPFAMASIAWSLSRDGRRVIHSSNADPEIDDETPIEVVFRHFEGKRVIWLASELAILMNSRSQSQLKSPILLSIYWLAYSYVFQLLGWNGLPASRFGLMYCSLLFFLLPSPLHAAPKSEEVAARKWVWRSLWRTVFKVREAGKLLSKFRRLIHSRHRYKVLLNGRVKFESTISSNRFIARWENIFHNYSLVCLFVPPSSVVMG